MDTVDPKDVVATILPNAHQCPGADPETAVASPEPPINRSDSVVTEHSGVVLRVLTGPSADFPVKDVVEEQNVVSFMAGFVDDTGERSGLSSSACRVHFK